jgi:glutamate 5-kinase
MIDYAYPTMMAEKALKDLHDAMLSRRYDAAKKAASYCVEQVLIAKDDIAVMEKKQNAKQAPVSV